MKTTLAYIALAAIVAWIVATFTLALAGEPAGCKPDTPARHVRKMT